MHCFYLKKCLIVFVGLIGVLFVAKSANASAAYYFNPQRKSLNVGETIQVELRLNTDGEAVNAHSALISFPSDILEVKADSTGNTFSIEAQRNFSDGFIEISEGSIDPVSGDVLIATLSVRAEEEGTAMMSFSDGSAVARYADSSDALSLSRSLAGFYTIEGGGQQTASQEEPKVIRQLKKIIPIKPKTIYPTKKVIPTTPQKLPEAYSEELFATPTNVKPTAIPFRALPVQPAPRPFWKFWWW
ncbi:MAG: hypothetical protein HY429_00450 [Candidatus Levybacteria bacterium]|nr:hypothetical protein [Candidatus Levybacteria bacterium]